MHTSALIVTVLVCGFAPLVLALTFGRRLGVPLRIVAIAVGFYALNLLLQQPFFLALRPVFAGASPLVIIAVGTPIVYAVSEEVMRYLSWRTSDAMRTHRTSNGAIVAGLAWGGAESLLFTGTQMLAPGVAVGTMATFAVGRLCAIATHVGLAHLSVEAYRRSAWFLPLVIVAHFVVDASVFGLTAVLDPSSLWASVLFAGFAVAAVLVSVRLRRGWAKAENNAQLAERCS